MRHPRSLLLIIGALAIAAVWIAGGGAANQDRSVLGASTPDADRWLWARQGGGEGWTYGNAIGLLQGGDVTAGGFFDSRARFDDIHLRARGEANGVLARYSSHGDLHSVLQIGDAGDASASSLVVLPDGGRVIIVGSIMSGILSGEDGEAFLGPTLVTRNREVGDTYVAIIPDDNGAPLSGFQLNAIGEAIPKAVALAEGGDIYIGGYFSGRLLRDGPVSTGEASGFILRASLDGEIRWIRSVVGEGRDEVLALTAATDGGVYAVGSFAREARASGHVLRSTPATGPHGEDATSPLEFFVAKYTAEGELEWIRWGRTAGIDPGAPVSGRPFRGIHHGSSQGWAVASRPEGGVIVGGSFRGNIEFAGQHFRATSSDYHDELLDDAFVAAFDGQGNELWMATGGGPAAEFHRGIATDRDGNVYATGSFMLDARFGGLELRGPGELGEFPPRLVYVVKFDSEGREQWAVQSYAESGQSAGTAIAVGDDGNCYLTGFFDGAADFGQHQLRGLRSRNMFVAALDCNR